MSKIKSKYDYRSRCDGNTKRFSVIEGFPLTDECDISQKIKTLELEGLKLRSQVEDILQESSDIQSSRTSEILRETDSCDSTPCDEPGRHAPRFAMSRSGDCVRPWAQYDDSNQANGSQQMNEYRQKLEFLQQKHKQDVFAHQLEKERLSETIEDLRRINFKLQSSIEEQTKEFQVMERKHVSMNERMRTSLSQLVSINKKQEETLFETNEKLGQLNNANSAIRAVEDLRDILMDVESYRGNFIPNDVSVESISPTTLVGIVDRCFKEYNSDLETRSRKIKELEDDTIQIKRALSHDREKSLQELRNQLAYVEEQNRYLNQHLEETNTNAEMEIERLREENNMIKLKVEEDMANATGVIDGLERNIQELSIKNKKALDAWSTEKKSLQKVLDDHEKQTAVTRAERDQAINQKSSITAKLDATQNQLSETETNLLQLQSDKYSLDKQVESLKKRNKEMEASLISSRKYFENIIKTVRSCSENIEDSNNNYESYDNSCLDNDDSDDQGQIWKPKKYQIDQIIVQVANLSKKEKDYDTKYEKLKKEYEFIEKQLEAVELHRRKIEQSYKAQQLDIDSAKNENSHINSLIANRNGEIERLTAERDYYFQLLNEKTDELAAVKTEKHRLTVSQLSSQIDVINFNYKELEERCRLLETQTNQSNDNHRSQIPDISAGKSQVIREDRKRLMVELKESKVAYEKLLLRLNEESRNSQTIRQENWNLQTDLKSCHRDYEDLVAQNKTTLMKLRDSEIEIANLCRELQNNHGSKSRKNSSLEKRVSESMAELTSCKNELKIAYERIKYLEKGCSKSSSKTPLSILNDIIEPSPTADNAKLTKSRLNHLELQMVTLESTQKSLKEENYKLTDLLKKVTSQNERMSEELENYVDENKRLREEIKSIDVDHLSKRKSERSSKKVKERSHNLNVNSSRMINGVKEQSSNEPQNNYGNDESIMQLREDLQGSIKEAKRLLSNIPGSDNSDDGKLYPHNISKEIYSKNNDINNFSQWTNRNQTNNNGHNEVIIERPEKMSKVESADSSTLNSRRSESASLTEADRHLCLPLNKLDPRPIRNNVEERPISPVQELLSLNKSPAIPVRTNDRDSYILEEKIKRLLTAES